MATQLWCCDYGCGYTEENKYRVELHEEHCDLNPENNNGEEITMQVKAGMTRASDTEKVK